MRRSLVVIMIACLLAGMLAGSADAAKKKKKKKKAKPPITFTMDGSLITSNPADLSGLGVTHNEFLASCSTPATQGLDGFVVEFSPKISKVAATVAVEGSDAVGLHDLDVYFYDADCNPTGESSTEAVNEYTEMVKGTKFAVVTAFSGVGIDFSLKATQKR